MGLAAQLFIARAEAANRRAARQRRRRLCQELADYDTEAQRTDLEATLDRYPDGVTYELRDILASAPIRPARPVRRAGGFRERG